MSGADCTCSMKVVTWSWSFSGSRIERMVAFTRSSYSSKEFDFLFIEAIRAAMFPKTKADAIAPMIIIALAMTV